MDALTPLKNSEAPSVALAQARERLEFFLKQSKSKNTLRSYLSDWNDFEAWCLARELAPMPALPSTVALYVADLADTRKPSTIRRRLSSISKLHQMAGHVSPTHDALVRTAWDGIRRTKGTYQQGKAPLLTDDIRAMVGSLPDTPIGVRNRALLLTGYAGCFRRSELVALNVEDVTFVPDGVILLVRKSKTDQEGEGMKKGIPNGTTETCPVKALKHWLDVSGVRSGPIFRPIDRHGNIRDRHLTTQSVADIIKAACRASGLDPEEYSGHSLRSGLATQAAISGATEAAIIRQGGWMSEKMARRYVRDGSLFRDNAAGKAGL